MNQESYSHSTKNEIPKLRSKPPKITLGKNEIIFAPKIRAIPQKKATVALYKRLLAPIAYAIEDSLTVTYPGEAPAIPTRKLLKPVIFNSRSRSKSCLSVNSNPL